MPSIRDLYTQREIEEEGVDPDLSFDLDALMSATDQALAESTRMRVPELEDSAEGGEAEVVPPPESLAEPLEEEEEHGTVPSAEEVPAVHAAQPDPLATLPPDRQAALLAMDRVFQEEPERRARVLQALGDQPVPPVELPEDIEPGSVEERLWRQGVETQRQLGELAQHNRLQQQAFVKQQAATAAERAGAAFGEKYDQLTREDVVEIARFAGRTGLAGRYTQGATNLEQAYGEMFEAALWTNPSFRAKVTDQVVAPPTPVAEKAESKDRKRKLTALSSSASPVSAAAPKRERLESDPVRGRLTPQSRLKAVQELATGIARQRSEGTF